MITFNGEPLTVEHASRLDGEKRALVRAYMAATANGIRVKLKICGVTDTVMLTVTVPTMGPMEYHFRLDAYEHSICALRRALERLYECRANQTI